jgi:Mg/Co/Ni transporter MgtE
MKCNIKIEIDESTLEGSSHTELVLTLRKLADELAQIQAFEGHKGIHREVHDTNGDSVGRIDVDEARAIWDGRLMPI